MIKVIEKENVERAYGFDGINAIIEHPKHGRLLVCDGYGGEQTLQGGQVRWRHGTVAKLLPEDTLDSLRSGEWNEITSLFDAVSGGYDTSRPLLDWHGSAIENTAKSAGL